MSRRSYHDFSFSGPHGNAASIASGKLSLPAPAFDKLIEASTKIGNERRVYRATLETYIPEHILSSGKVRIISPGCGKGTEAKVLNSFFGGQRFGSQSENVEFFGIDIDEKSISSARIDHLTTDFIPDPKYTFALGDATKPADHVSGFFDVIVYSHPEVRHNEKTWEEIFSASEKLHKAKGILIATFYLEDELESAKKMLSERYTILVASENRHYSEDMALSPNRHRYVLFGIKKE